METDTTSKQNYLRENILDKGYDVDLFYQHLQGVKAEDCEDLTNWSFSELEQCVQEFIDGLKPKEGTHQKLVSNSGLIKCNEAPIEDTLKEQNIVIQLSSPERTENGIFSKGYVTYLITTYPLNYSVRRRYSDFEWLRQYFSSRYINTVIPPLPKKTYYKDRFNNDFLLKRMRKLEKFLNGIITNPILFYNPVFLDFISSNEKQWIVKQRYYCDVHEIPDELEKIYSLYGHVHYNITPDHEKEFTNIKDNVESNEKLIFNLLSLYKNFFTHMDEMVSQINAITDAWKQLKEMSKISKDSKLEKIYKTWANSSSKISKAFEIQNSLYNNEMKGFFKFYINELKELKELTYKCENSQNEYYKEYNQLLNKKDYLFNKQMQKGGVTDTKKDDGKTQKITELEKMFPEETKNTLRLKQWYGMYLKSVISEYNRLNQVHLYEHIKLIGSFGNTNMKLFNELQISYGDLVTVSNQYKS